MGKQGAKPIQDEVERFLHTNGVEWTCSRMKSIWTASNHLRNGDTESAVAVYRDSSIAYHKGSSIPKGPIGVLVRRYVDAKKPSVIRKYAACLRYYTGLHLEGKPSPKQSKKSVASISKSYTGSHDKREIEVLLVDPFVKRFKSLPGYVKKDVRECAHARNLHSDSYYFTGIDLRDKAYSSMYSKPYGKLVLSLMSEAWVPDTLAYRFTKSSEARITQLDEYGIDSGYAGRILGMQQNGCKLRVVAQPTAALQRVFTPLHASLMTAVEAMYPLESCVRDQERGAYAVRDHLAHGNAVYSVDLSSATDRFPRWFSEALLNLMGLGYYSEALEQVCNRPWKNSNLIGPKDLYYETGQPMGLYGSFPLFHLSNLAVADSSVHKAMTTIRWGGTNKLVPFADGTFFKVVGDDIVMSDKEVAYHYERDMLRLGVDISPTKTFRGNVAEFAGFLATKSSRGFTCFRPYKVPTKEWITNPLDFVHALGKDVKSISPRWERIFDAYQRNANKRLIDLSPIERKDSEPRAHLVGKESYTRSLIQMASNAMMESRDRSRQMLCIRDWLTERSGYNFAMQSFETYADSVISTRDYAERLGDVAFSPDLQLEMDKLSKAQEVRKVESNFWRDPLNSVEKDSLDPDHASSVRILDGQYVVERIGSEGRPHLVTESPVDYLKSLPEHWIRFIESGTKASDTGLPLSEQIMYNRAKTKYKALSSPRTKTDIPKDISALR
jgi:hypothetical protein